MHFVEYFIWRLHLQYTPFTLIIQTKLKSYIQHFILLYSSNFLSIVRILPLFLASLIFFSIVDNRKKVKSEYLFGMILGCDCPLQEEKDYKYTIDTEVEIKRKSDGSI